MHRRGSLCTALVTALLAGLSCAPELPESGASSCPDCNVVLVTFDALAARRIGFFGAQRNTTPELDRFARDAFVFTDAISQAGTSKDVHLRLGADASGEPSAWTFGLNDAVRIDWANPDTGNITWGLEVGLAVASEA